MPTEEFPANGADRREVIKRAAIAGGLVWSAPSVRRFASFAARGTPTGTTTTTATVPETTTTTLAEPCDCYFCATVTSGPLTIYLDCDATSQAACDCICACGGVNRPCNEPDPCTVQIVCTPRPGNEPCPEPV